MPEFWKLDKNNYKLRLMTSEILLPLNWPVEVCYHEAHAFCNWKSSNNGKPIRMPDEAEYRRLLEYTGLDHEHHDQPIQANWNLEYGCSSVAVDQFAHGDFYDIVGNVWQWNETPIHAFNGFKVHSLYDDFSTPTFDNNHNLIKVDHGFQLAMKSQLEADMRFVVISINTLDSVILNLNQKLSATLIYMKQMS